MKTILTKYILNQNLLQKSILILTLSLSLSFVVSLSTCHYFPLFAFISFSGRNLSKDRFNCHFPYSPSMLIVDASLRNYWPASKAKM